MKKIIARYYTSRVSRRSFELAEGDLSSVADVAFLLLIFFIVTSSFAINEGILLNLPSKESSAIKVDREDIVDIYPQAEGFKVENEFYDRKQLGEMLVKGYADNPDLVAIIHMVSPVKYERLVDSLSVIKESGLPRVSVKNE